MRSPAISAFVLVELIGILLIGVFGIFAVRPWSVAVCLLSKLAMIGSSSKDGNSDDARPEEEEKMKGGKVSWRRQRSQRKAVAGDLVGQGGDQTKGGKSSDKGQPGNKGGKSSGKGQPDNKGAGHQGRYKESARAKAGTYHSASSGPWVCCTNL